VAVQKYYLAFGIVTVTNDEAVGVAREIWYYGRSGTCLHNAYRILLVHKQLQTKNIVRVKH
jgi:hypothetical protein